MSAKYFMILLCCVLSLKYAESQTCEVKNDRSLAFKCSNCKSAYVCSSSSPDPVTTFDCADGEACSEEIADCVITESLKFGECGCSDESDEVIIGSYTDPIDGEYYVTCDADGIATYSHCPGGFFDDDVEECVEIPECEPDITGNIAIETSCKYYLSCSFVDDPEVNECAEGTVFDYYLQSCSPTDVCNDVTSSDIKVIDPFKCNIFHICSDQSSVICCPLGQNYNAETGLCAEASESGCERTFLNSCLEEEYENLYCKYCLVMSDGDTYSTYLGSECQTQYYECVEEGSELVARLRECAEGKVYAADTGVCEYIEAHPYC